MFNSEDIKRLYNEEQIETARQLEKRYDEEIKVMFGLDDDTLSKLKGRSVVFMNTQDFTELRVEAVHLFGEVKGRKVIAAMFYYFYKAFGDSFEEIERHSNETKPL